MTSQYSAAVAVTLEGYPALCAMEPFVSRNKLWLFCNDDNTGPNPELYCLKRVTDTHFKYYGKVGKVNTSAMECVPSMDAENCFYFISPRTAPVIGQPLQSLYSGIFTAGVVDGIKMVPNISVNPLPSFIMDAEIASNGNDLYFVEATHSSTGGPPIASKMKVAHGDNGQFTIDPNSDYIFKNINTTGPVINYAPSTTIDQLTLYFTRYNPSSPPPQIWVSTRLTINDPWSTPTHVDQAVGYVEGPCVDGEGKNVYFHRLKSVSPNVFEIAMITKS